MEGKVTELKGRKVSCMGGKQEEERRGEERRGKGGRKNVKGLL